MAKTETDAILIERFVTGRDERAFDTLGRRHRPTVQGICRRVLRNEHDIEDVAQATFFVLSSKASAIAWDESVRGWLCSVAYRLALHARACAWRRRAHETSIASFDRVALGCEGGRLPEHYHPVLEPSNELERQDLRDAIDDELLRLPEPMRALVVLCDLEGRTHAEAARRLGCPAGSIYRRLERGRAILRARLAERGITLVLLVIGLALAIDAAGRGRRPAESSLDSVRRAMTPLKEWRDGDRGKTEALAAAARADGALSREPILRRAIQAEKAAGEIRRRRPDTVGAEWERYTDDMEQSARQLSRAVQRDDRLAVVAAARRLDTSCQKCHDAFWSRQPEPLRAPLVTPSS